MASVSSSSARRRQGLDAAQHAYDDMVIALNRAQADAAPLDQQIALRTTPANRDRRAAAQPRRGRQVARGAQRERRTLEELVHTYRARYEEAR